MATTEKKFKKVRLFKLIRELNVTKETIVDFLKEHGYSAALSGSDINASITDEEAYTALLAEFAEDRAAAQRVHDLRRERETERDEVIDEGQPETPSLGPEPVEEPEPAEAERGDGMVTPDAAEPVVVEVEEPPVQEEPLAEAPRITEETVVEVPAEPTSAPQEPVSEASGELPEPQAPETLSVPEAPKASTAKEKPTPAPTPPPKTPPTIEPIAEPVDEEEVEDVEAGLLTADRYQLRGTTIVGKIDLSEVEDDRPGRRKRKRKRKKEASTEEGKVTIKEAKPKEEEDTSGRKRKRKRRVKVDEEDVEQTLQDTLRELEMGAARVRQRRRRERRDRHAEERERERQEMEASEQTLRVTEFVSTGELANLMGVSVNEVISSLFKSGMIVSINQRLDADTIRFVADEFDMEVEFITDVAAEDIELEEDDPQDLRPRAPVVTVMGHVDHGKTSLLDHIRKTNVVAGESGGITQHIGAYQVKLPDDREITFLDTPGHEAFTAMRARGAQVTDVVILVVAANDAVMPQTIEAINHAKAAEVPMVVAINKIDLPEANPQRVMTELADQNVLVESYGGNVQVAEVSAKTGKGVDDLLEKVMIQAEFLELQGNPDRNANGVVIEARLDKGRGNVATILVQNGTLRVGDAFVAGTHSGRVRAMFDERDKRIEKVGPSEPALVLGFSGAPDVGDSFIVLDDEAEARDIAQRRAQIAREQQIRQRKHVRLEDIGRRLALGDFNELNLIIKGDVGGSVEALSDSLLKLSTDEVVLNIIHSGVGAISESDVMLASASDAIVIGFQVRPTAGARAAAEREEIEIKTYSIIYNVISDIRDALEGLLRPEESEKMLGAAEVRETFKVPKAGTVAGCYITEGRIHRNDRIRLVREGVVIYTGSLASLRRFKEDVREVQSGYECGMSIENFNDIKVGDVIEAFQIVETKRKLEV